ncbi:hypothetical protein Tsubulata_012660 [Turnera subulata]|uniref:FAR1 domain-containing protein n=1 Tax=Turnera subulata TaxID=218843 RepID=A0A9Q0G187_9ROSI|nr:hypothetical protein Tsubulata_012660 [Turnera subulata]
MSSDKSLSLFGCKDLGLQDVISEEEDVMGSFMGIIDLKKDGTPGFEVAAAKADINQDCALKAGVASEHINQDSALKVGMLFNSDKEAYDAYNAYGVEKGFGVRKSFMKYNSKGQVIRREMCCSCNEESDVIVRNEERKREWLEYRCGCTAKIVFKVTNGLYQITYFNDEHNLTMIEKDKRHFICSARKLGQPSKQILGSLVEAGIKPKKAFRYAANEAGGSQNAGFREQDCHNFIQQRRQILINGGDASSVLNHFGAIQAQDSSFYYAIDTDDEGRHSLGDKYGDRNFKDFKFRNGEV